MGRTTMICKRSNVRKFRHILISDVHLQYNTMGLSSVEQFGVEDTDSYEEALDKVVTEVIADWAWRCPTGTPDVSDPSHINELRASLSGFGLDDMTISNLVRRIE